MEILAQPDCLPRRHAGRSSILADDVKLACRRNPDLVGRLSWQTKLAQYASAYSSDRIRKQESQEDQRSLKCVSALPVEAFEPDP